jgi:hypothetical protein
LNTTVWNKECNRTEPSATRLFRGALLQCRCVSQLFDPWYMDSNTQDKQAPTPNEMKTPNEVLHKDHLHVTVREALLSAPGAGGQP